MTEDEYRKKKLDYMESMCDSLSELAEYVHKIWNDMPEPDVNH